MNGYNPLPVHLKLGESKIDGTGLFAVGDLPEHTKLGISHYDAKDIHNGDYFHASVIRTPIGGWVNHSGNPNCVIKKDGPIWYLTTIKEVKSGIELTLDYREYRCGINPNEVCAKDI